LIPTDSKTKLDADSISGVAMLGRLVLFLLVLFAAIPAMAGGPALSRDEILRETGRITVTPAQGPSYVLATLVMRPAGPGRYPLALLTHGTPRDAKERPNREASGQSEMAMEFARRGYAAVVVLRRGYGQSDGPYAESPGRNCETPDYMLSVRAGAADLQGALAWARRQPFVDARTIIAVGPSAGGFASLGLAAERPEGLKAVISFAGGRGSTGPDELCNEARLTDAFAQLGRAVTVPSLWVYAENDHFFGPRVARGFLQAYTRGGATVDFVMMPPFGEDGHYLSGRAGTALWRPIVDRFLNAQGLPNWSTPPSDPPVPDYPPPVKLGETGTKAWKDFLAGSGHKAFAASPQGRYGWAGGRDELDTARSRALGLCAGDKNAPNCVVIAVDEGTAGIARAPTAPLGAPPAPLGENATKAWASYVKAKNHKAFAINDQGRFGWANGQDVAAARAKALGYCAGEGQARGCRLIAVDDTIVKP
jgi:dienelactone hydrolase